MTSLFILIEKGPSVLKMRQHLSAFVGSTDDYVSIDMTMHTNVH